MPALFRPSATERRRIREAAAREARMEVGSVILQLGQRRSLTGRGSAFNISEISDDAQIRAEECWRRHKAPMATYWKVVSVYAGHIARVLR